jgi:Fe-S cluster assembly iron-binding protein IscA
VDLVLDELTNNDQNVVKDNDVNVVYDSKLKAHIEARPSLIIDYDEEMSESGFFVQSSNACC